MCVQCSLLIYKSECVTTVSWALWSQWACHMSIRLLHHYRGWCDSVSVTAETTRQQARKLHTGWLRGAWSDCWGPSTHCYSDHVVMRLSWRGEWSHGGSDASSPPCCCQSLHLTLSTTDTFFAQRRRGLQPCKFGCSVGYVLLKPDCWFH